MRDVQRTVRIAEEGHVGHTDCGRRGALLGLSNARDLVARHARVEPAGVAVRHDAVADVDALRHPRRDAAGCSEVHVIGMGGHHQDAFDLRLVLHRHSMPDAAVGLSAVGGASVLVMRCCSRSRTMSLTSARPYAATPCATTPTAQPNNGNTKPRKTAPVIAQTTTRKMLVAAHTATWSPKARCRRMRRASCSRNAARANSSSSSPPLVVR